MLLGDSAPVGLFEADSDMIIQTVNPWMVVMTGCPPEHLEGRAFRSLLTNASQVVYALKVEAALLDLGAVEEVFLELDHADGRPRAVLLTVCSTGNPSGTRVGALFTATERRAYELELIATRRALTEKAEAENRARLALEDINERLSETIAERTQALLQRDLLLREVYHRVKNNLQVVDGLLHMQSRRLSDPEAIAGLESLQRRIYSLGLAHQQLMQSENLRTFDIAAFLSELMARLEEGGMDGVRLKFAAVPLNVDLDFAIPLGLLVTELVTNALKHAFPHGSGEIDVTLSAPSDAEVILRVSDDGVGLAADAMNAKTGLGMMIVRGLTRQLGGRLDVVPSAAGVCWEGSFPTPVIA